MKLTGKQEYLVTYSGLSVSLLLCLLAIFGLILSGCARENVHGSGRVITEERPVDRFEDLTVEGPLEIHVKQGSPLPLRIEAEDNVMRVIETSVNGTNLRVKIRNGVNLKSFRPIHIYVQSEKYRRIIFSGSGSLTGTDTIRTPLFLYEVNGSNDARLKVDANEVRVLVNGSGNIDLEGLARDYYSEINGSGDVRAELLKANNANVETNGSGEQRIWAVDRLWGHIRGSGNVKYKGTPADFNVKVSGSGRVSKL